MNKFEKQLEKWNNGILRGAQAKLAKRLQVTTATVALWATGKRRPSKGYIAQMARLFFLDEHSVERLFTPARTHTQPTWSTPSWTLHDSESSYFTNGYSTLNNTVALPVFAQIPPTYPQFSNVQVRAWWHVASQAAGQTDFLFLLPTRNDPERLLFVKYCPSWEKGKIMLVKQGTKYQLVHVEQVKPTLVVTPLENVRLLAHALPIGLVRREIRALKITP